MQDYNDPWWDEYLSTGEDPTGGEISGEEDGGGWEYYEDHTEGLIERAMVLSGGNPYDLAGKMAKCPGVYSVRLCYANGFGGTPSHEAVQDDTMGFAEGVVVFYDLSRTTHEAVIRFYLDSIDFTDKKFQKGGFGHWRNSIIYQSEEQHNVAVAIHREMRKAHKRAFNVCTETLYSFFEHE